MNAHLTGLNNPFRGSGRGASPVHRHRRNLTGMAGNVGTVDYGALSFNDFRAMGARFQRENPPIPRPGHRIIMAARA